MCYNNDVKRAKDTIPYRFVPIKESKYDKIPREHLNKYNKELFSGKLFCSLYGVNPLCVGNTHIKENPNDDKSPTRIFPLELGGKLAISPYTLKGAISNFLAAYVGNPMTRLEKKGFLFRPNIAFHRNNSKYKIGVGIVTEIVDNENEFYIKISKINTSPKFKLKKNLNLISTQEKYSIGTFQDFTTQDNYYVYDYPDGIDGNGKLLSSFLDINTDSNTKHHDCIMFIDSSIENNREDYLISWDKLKSFYKNYDFLKEYHLKNHPNIKKEQINELKGSFETMKEFNIGSVLFFEYNTITNDIITFGKTFYYPWAYSRELSRRWFPKDIGYLKDEFIDDKISILRDMFGYTLTKDDEELLDFTDLWTVIIELFSKNKNILKELKKEKEFKKYNDYEIFDDIYNDYEIDYDNLITSLDFFDFLDNFLFKMLKFEKITKNNYSDYKNKMINRAPKSGKVHFNFAIQDKRENILVKEKTLPRPGTPKPSSYEFYLQQNGNTPLTTYGDPARKDYIFNDGKNVRLSGRKFYMKSKQNNSLKDYNRNNIDDYSIILDKVLMGTEINPSKFKFTVNFENLTKKQLELLTFALDLNKNNDEATLYHQIGYGKNYGMGAVKIEVNKAQIIKLEDEKLSLNEYDVKKLQEKIKLNINKLNDSFKNILKLHETEFNYPKLGNADDATIKWHSKIRSEDLKKRRK